MRFTVRDVQVMVEHGVLPEDGSTELLHGVIVLKDRSDAGDQPHDRPDSGDPPTVHGKKHRKCVVRLSKLSARIDSPAQHVQTQLPLVCGADEAPEPDFAVVRGTEDDYDDTLPTGGDASCVIEVADSSFERDADEKLPIYAAAGVPQYVILNLRNRTAQVYADPDPAAAAYRPPSVLPEDQDLHLNLPDGTRLAVLVRELLP